IFDARSAMSLDERSPRHRRSSLCSPRQVQDSPAAAASHRDKPKQSMSYAGDSMATDASSVDTTSSMKTDDDDVTSASPVTEQAAGDFSSPPRSTSPPDWMSKLTWAPRIPRIDYAPLRSHYYSDEDDDCPVPMKARKIDCTPIRLDL
ncbi:hypothetical protein PFISCL1PPCAC_3155, partial [Pristionchus fissidentatus]